MAYQWIKTEFDGVRYREHPTRMVGKGKNRHPDLYFSIRYQVAEIQPDGSIVKRTKEEGLGWSSSQQRWTVTKAVEEREKLVAANKEGTGPRTRKQKREHDHREAAAKRAAEITVAEFWPEYLVHLKSRLSKPTSWRQEVQHYERRILPLLGGKVLRDVTPGDVESLVARMKRDGLKPRTQKYAVGTMFRIWKYAARHKLVRADDNPALGIAIENKPNTRQRILAPEELKNILDRLAILDRAAHDITLFCAFTGCRFSEAARLTWDRVDLVAGEAEFTDTKNQENRLAYLVPGVVDMLKARARNGDLVFIRLNGQPYRQPPHAFMTVVKNLKLNEGRDDYNRVTFHSLRHTAATRAARSVNVKDMQVIFGWRTPSMVFRYAKGDEDTQRAAMSNIAQGLTGESGQVIPIKRQKAG